MQPENTPQPKPKNNLYAYATKKRVILLTSLYIFSTVLVMAAASDLFTVNPFQKGFTLLFILVLANTFFMGRLWATYLKKRKEGIA
jgi:hypothetical protein